MILLIILLLLDLGISSILCWLYPAFWFPAVYAGVLLLFGFLYIIYCVMFIEQIVEDNLEYFIDDSDKRNPIIREILKDRKKRKELDLEDWK